MISETLKYASNVAPEDLALKIRTSKTWKLDKIKKRVTNELIDEKEALKQAVFIHLSIENQSSFIHTDGFGVQMAQFYGMNRDLAKAKLPDAIKDALAWDERILDVSEFEFEDLDKNKLKVSFQVSSCYGDFGEEVIINA